MRSHLIALRRPILRELSKVRPFLFLMCYGLSGLSATRRASAGAVQSSTYNTRLLVPEVMVNGDAFHVIRPRPTYDDLIGLDSVPDWLK